MAVSVRCISKCVEGLVLCMSQLRDAYAVKGTDSNYEAEVELRHCTAIALKHPFKTVLAYVICLCRLVTLACYADILILTH